MDEIHTALADIPPSPEAQTREFKYAPLDLQQVEADGRFCGYASLFNIKDLSGDMLLPGAFRNSLKQRGTSGIKLLFQHDPAQPIGVWTTLKEDSTGLYAEGQLMTDVIRAKEIMSLMRAGAIDGLSIGFHTVKAKRDPHSGVRHVSEVDLWEISIVTFPMLPEARVSRVKDRLACQDWPSEREFERWLTREAGFTRSAARTLIGQGYRALRVKRDADQKHAFFTPQLVERITRATQMLHQARNRT